MNLERRIEEALPCAWPYDCEGGPHDDYCPASYRPAILALLKEVWLARGQADKRAIERLRQRHLEHGHDLVSADALNAAQEALVKVDRKVGENR